MCDVPDLISPMEVFDHNQAKDGEKGSAKARASASIHLNSTLTP